MNIAEQLDAVSGTNRLVLVEFYADWSPHYEWLEPVVPVSYTHLTLPTIA